MEDLTGYKLMPATDAGRLARRLLTVSTDPDAATGVGKDVAGVLLMRRRRKDLAKILDVAFGIAARRHLTFAGDGELDQYVGEVLDRQDVFLPGMMPNAAKTKAVLRRAIGWGGEKPKRRFQHDLVALAVLTDLAIQMSASDIDEMLALAELRLGVRPQSASELDGFIDELKSDVGRFLMRVIMTGKAGVEYSPKSSANNFAVFDAAFELASIRMLGRPLNDVELDTWAAKLARVRQDVSADQIKAIVRNPYGSSIADIGNSGMVAMVRVASANAALWCLLASEALDVLRGAEQLARRRGFKPEQSWL